MRARSAGAGIALILCLIWTSLVPNRAASQVRIARSHGARLLPPRFESSPRTSPGNRVASLPIERLPAVSESDQFEEIPPGETVDYKLSWLTSVKEPLTPSAASYGVNVSDLVLAALNHAPEVIALRTETAIRETAIAVADAEFDISAFVESRYSQISQPVGNVLTTGALISPNAPTRLRDSLWTNSAGLRKRTRLGGTVGLSQELAHQDSNSLFFIPNAQGTAQLTLNYTQPLLTGAGRHFNQSFRVLAQIDVTLAEHQVAGQLQDIVQTVVQLYWQHYLQRALFVQSRTSFERGQQTLNELRQHPNAERYSDFIEYGEATIDSRREQQTQSMLDIQDGVSDIRALIQLEEWHQTDGLEILTLETPNSDPFEVDVHHEVAKAMTHRAEINAAISQIHSMNIQLKLAKNALLPSLSAVLETHVRGLRGAGDVTQAFVDQFTVGDPSYTAGLVFETPLGHRAARAQYHRNKLEMSQLLRRLDATAGGVRADVERAARRIGPSLDKVQQIKEVLAEQQEQLSQFEKQWAESEVDNPDLGELFQALLSSQDGVASAEFAYAQAQAEYAVAVLSLHRATGTLLHVQPTH